MVPRTILDKLDRVRRRDLGFRLSWGAVRWGVLALAALLGACLLDWGVDRWYETPGGLRAALLVLQAGLWAGAAGWLLVRPCLRKRDDREVALWVEDKVPELGHRLISAVQLNQPGARTEGMSPALIEAVTRQAQELSAAQDFAGHVDFRPLRKASAVLGGVAAAATLLVLLSPATAAALLARQFLADRAIPRSILLESDAAERVWPSGEEGALLFLARGKRLDRVDEGEVRIYPEGRPAESYRMLRQAMTGEDAAVYRAVIPPGSISFGFRAWLGDGRTRRPAQVRYEPRPVVRKIDAWLVLPEYVGLRPGGARYEQPMARGEIAGPSGSSARVLAEVQKPVTRAIAEVLGRQGTEAEALLRTVDLALKEGGREAEASFELRPGETTYRILVEDRHGFRNSAPPRRGVAIVPDEPPRVVLLPERFSLPGETGPADEADVEGMPVPLESPIRVAYYSSHPYGIDRARLAWRILKGGKVSEEVASTDPEIPWSYLPLGEVRATPDVGAFDLRRGTFEKTGFYDQVEFHPVPSPDPERVHGRTEGGGRFDFQTQPLKGVQVGDQIEFCVEVFARNPALDKFPGRSEARLKAFVTRPQFFEWLSQNLKHEHRIRMLETRQRGVFTPEGTDR